VAVAVTAAPSDAIADTIAATVEGRTDYLLAPISLALAHIRGGTLVALAVTAYLGQSIFYLTCILGVLGVPAFMRVARASTLTLARREFVIAAQTVIPAVSQAADLTFLPVEADFEVNRGRVKVDPATYATNVRGVFACGDFVTGPTTLIEAAGHGKKCAYAIDRYLSGRTDVTVSPNVKITSSWRHDMPEMYDVLPRQHIPMAPPQARMPSTDPVVNFNTPVELGYDANGAVAESTRCLMCNFNIWFDPFRCVLCGACADVCPEGVIHMVDINTLKSEGALPELEEAYGWDNGGAMILDEERCIRCALCVKRCPFDAITMERFELQEISTDGRLYKESYRDAQLAGTPGVAGGPR